MFIILNVSIIRLLVVISGFLFQDDIGSALMCKNGNGVWYAQGIVINDLDI